MAGEGAQLDFESRKRQLIGEAVDSMAILDWHARGIMPQLYAAARAVVGTPLCLAAAELLLETVRKADIVFIATGFNIAPFAVPETDGLASSVLLARVLEMECNAKPVIVTEAEAVPILEAACTAGELNVCRSLEKLRSWPHSVQVLPFTKDGETAIEDARELVELYRPALMVSVERAGMNSQGVYHGAMGKDISDTTAKIDRVFEHVKDLGRPTVGVGDLGNELGLGNISGAIASTIPFGETCLCPCGEGTVAAVESDVPVVGSSSENAVFGILACLVHLTGDGALMPGDRLLRSVYETISRHGAVDGPTGYSRTAVDLVPLEDQIRIVALLRRILECSEEHSRLRPEFIQLGMWAKESPVGKGK